MINPSELCLDSASPFESIRRIDEVGTEYWLARELMPKLGYSRWAEFKSVVDRGELACQNTGNTVIEHFSGLTLKSPGRSAKDWKLSRLGAYLVSMNGDPRKSEVAAAQAYFAIKTREAELAPSVPSDSLEVLLGAVSELIKQRDEIRAVKAKQAEQSYQLESQEQRIAKIERDRNEAEQSLRALPPSTVEPEELTTRILISRVVRDYVRATNMDYCETWRLLYREFRDRYHIDLITRAKTEKSKPLDVAERLGRLEALYAVATKILVPAS